MIAIDIGLYYTQKQQLNMNINLISAIDILSKNQGELIDFINNEAEENVFIDFFDKDTYYSNNKSTYINYDNKNNPINELLSDKDNLFDYLMKQLIEIKLTPEEQRCGEFIIYSLDENGFFNEDIYYSLDKLKVSMSCFNKVLNIIKSFEPIGVGCNNFRDCLIAQTKDPILIKLIDNHLEDVAENNYSKIISSMGISETKLISLIKRLKKLKPKPLQNFDKSEINYIVPEIVVKKQN